MQFLGWWLAHLRFKNYLPAFITLVLFCILFVRYYDRGPSRNYSDFRVYHVTAQRLLAGENIYEAEDTSKITPFKYSPLFAVLISPLGVLSIHQASLVFFTFNFFLLGIIGVFSARFLAFFESLPSSRWGRILLYGVPAVAVFRFALLVLDSGQALFLMVAPALLGLYLIEKKQELWGGLFLALSVMVKYLTIIFLPYLILRKKWKAVFSTLVGILVGCFLPTLFFGWERACRYLLDWLPFITKTSLDQGSWTDYKNQSLYSWVIRWVMKESPYTSIQPSFSLLSFNEALKVGILAAVVLYVGTLFSKIKEKESSAVIYATLFVGLALFSPNSWPFNYAVLFFPFMVLIAALLRNPFQNKGVWVLVVAAIFLLNIGSQSISPDKIQYASEVLSFMTLGGLCVWVALLRLKTS